ncbi:MAG: FtsK/SpoIIIE domain-containing protein [Clostridiales bacterium]
MEKKIDITQEIFDFFIDIGINTLLGIRDLTPELFKNKSQRILFLISSLFGIYPIIKFNIPLKSWFIFLFNYFLIAGIFRTLAKLKYRRTNRELYSIYKKKIFVINSIDTEKFINRTSEIYNNFKNNIHKINKEQSKTKLTKLIIILKVFYKNNIFKNSSQPIKKYILRSSVPIESISRKKSNLSHLFDTNIISITQGNSKKIIVLKTCKQNIKNTDKTTDKIQFLLNEFGFDISRVLEEIKDSMSIYTIKTTSEFEKINKKCDHLAFRLGIDKKKTYMKESKGIIQFIISGESKIYPFIDHIDNKKIKNITKNMQVPALLGVNLENGKLFIKDLAKMPHCLVMGGTGGGKSCFLNVLIQSIMYFNRNTSFLMLDFKYVELNIYEDFKNVHFINNYKDASRAIELLNIEMNRRLQLFAKLKVKNLKSYNLKFEPLPYLVVVIDEAADIILEADNKKNADIVNTKLNQIINKARASGVVIIYAMQRANSDQINTGIRSQLMTKIGFCTSSEKEKQFIEIDNLTGLEQGEYRWKKGDEEYFVKGLFIDDDKISTNKIYQSLEKFNSNIYDALDKDKKVVNITKKAY